MTCYNRDAYTLRSIGALKAQSDSGLSAAQAFPQGHISTASDPAASDTDTMKTRVAISVSVKSSPVDIVRNGAASRKAQSFVADRVGSPPVLLLAFNRPDLTERVFESIRAVRPRQLFFAVDGPRSDVAGEPDRVFAVRALAESVDWECDLKTLFRERNLGLKTAVSEAISWFFADVEEGIVLEDDCVAEPTFFRFAGELLEKYRDEKRVMAISGSNFQFGRRFNDCSYYFSRYNHMWGWASWRRAWRLYDHRMSRWEEMRASGWLGQFLQDNVVEAYWRRIFDGTHAEELNSWAYRWTFACWANGGLTALPNVNLISNIGFGGASTHTYFRGRVAEMPTGPMQFPLVHPPEIVRIEAADQVTETVLYSRARPILRMLKRIAKTLGVRRGQLWW